MNELNHLNGKGDKERSPGWRENYPEIKGFGTTTGFTRVNAARTRKVYGVDSRKGFEVLQCTPTLLYGGVELGRAITSVKLAESVAQATCCGHGCCESQ
jgi:hypothetical protein